MLPQHVGAGMGNVMMGELISYYLAGRVWLVADSAISIDGAMGNY